MTESKDADESYVEVPPFDVLAGDSAPFTGFGDVLPPSLEVSETFFAAAEEARRRVEEGFRRDLSDPKLAPQRLDEIIAEMWDHGWSPKIGKVNLFVRDFGLVLSKAVLTLCGGTPTFRSKTAADHFSIWWPAQKLEAFPFHHVLKCLWDREGNSCAFFVKGLTDMLQHGLPSGTGTSTP